MKSLLDTPDGDAYPPVSDPKPSRDREAYAKPAVTRQSLAEAVRFSAFGSNLDEFDAPQRV